jgi:hypothetical protein
MNSFKLRDGTTPVLTAERVYTQLQREQTNDNIPLDLKTTIQSTVQIGAVVTQCIQYVSLNSAPHVISAFR